MTTAADTTDEQRARELADDSELGALYDRCNVDSHDGFWEELSHSARKQIAGFADAIRRDERAHIVGMIRENAPDLVLFAGGRTPPLDLLAWILELPQRGQ